MKRPLFFVFARDRYKGQIGYRIIEKLEDYAKTPRGFFVSHADIEVRFRRGLTAAVAHLAGERLIAGQDITSAADLMRRELPLHADILRAAMDQRPWRKPE